MIPIIVIDLSNKGKFCNRYVNDFIKSCITKIKENYFRLVFWDGKLVQFPYVSNKSTLLNIFDRFSNMDPGKSKYLDLNEIHAEWLDKFNSIVYLFTANPHLRVTPVDVLSLTLTTVGFPDDLDIPCTKHIVYTEKIPAGFIKKNEVVLPSGLIPFKDTYFSELELDEFIASLKVDDPITLAKDLSYTIPFLIEDKPKSVSKEIISKFCSLFKDPTPFVMAIFDIKFEDLSQHKKSVLDLKRSIDLDLQKNVKKSVHITDCTTLPIGGKVYRGSNPNYDWEGYKNCAIKIGDTIMPVIPLNEDVNEIHLREWIKIIMSKTYKVNKELSIYMFLSLTLQMIYSDYLYKDQYITLANILLDDVRCNSKKTTLELIKSGKNPIPDSGKIEDMKHYLSIAAKHFDIPIFDFWYRICYELGHEENQKRYKCSVDYINVKNIEICDVPVELNFTCPVTMKSCLIEGGYMIKAHDSCSPNCVISKEAVDYLTCIVCPECFLDCREYLLWVDPVDRELTITGDLIILKGAPGSGKSKWALDKKQDIEGSGGYCLIVNENDQSQRDAILNLNHIDNDKIVVIYDSCGVKDSNIIMGIDFKGWKKKYVWPNFNKEDTHGYLAWSLQNSNNPDLHASVSKKLFGSKVYREFCKRNDHGEIAFKYSL